MRFMSGRGPPPTYGLLSLDGTCNIYYRDCTRIARQYKPAGQELWVTVGNVVTYCVLEQFSRGYYFGRLYVEPSPDETATMCSAQHERVNRQLYTDGEGVERTDRPLVMKVGTRHLAVPEDVLDETVQNPPTLTEALLTKADRAAQLLDLSGGATRV